MQFRSLAIQMGGVLIKVGQFFSSRVDVLPGEITSELSGLQDEVPPDDFEEISRVAEEEFGAPVTNKFDFFDKVPIAAASLGQVYQAGLRNGEPCKVVVKIQRPNIENIIATDLAALRTVGNWVQRYPAVRKRADVSALLAEFTRILYEEIDYIAEGHNAEKFAENFQGDKEVRVPHVIWSHTTRRVLTLEDVHAIKITDYEAITQAGIDRNEVARRLLNTYLKQIFEDGFFHADPHPGNLFVSPVPPASSIEQTAEGEQPDNHTWQLTFIDFGMVGRVAPKMRSGMREMLIAIGTRDASRLVKSYQLLDVLLPNADLSLLEKAETEAFDRFWGKNMNELTQISVQELRDFAFQFRSLIYNLPFQVPEDLILLGRTVGILSGMCTGLDPEFNVWDGLAPFAYKLIAEDIASSKESWLKTLGILAQKMLTLPQRTDTMLEKMERGELQVRDPQLTEQMRRVELVVRKMMAAILFSGLLLAGVQLLLGGQVQAGRIFLALSVVVLLWIFLMR